ncbi:competence protein CoiA [Serratia marcescens]|uniref:competence protein CoiA family protein n=1 Tax=Serratia marcescens TaxID=615 RepID=UPI0013DB4CBE|nr:competence protein CoiA [Serratia marcescens]
MAMINHIPFGLRIEDQLYVDVADVPRGKQCACICPSCRIPLVARQGKANRWHFAHASRNVNEVDKECVFSFFVSVRTMAKQLLEAGMSVMLPTWRDVIIEKRNGHVFSESYWITRATDVTLNGVKKECFFEGVSVDITGFVENYPLVIYFTHPGRVLPSELLEPLQQSCCILEIKLDETIKLFAKKNITCVKFIDELKVFIESNQDARRWVYHSRKVKERQKAQERLAQSIVNHQENQKDNNRSCRNKIKYYRWQHYLCSICLNQWKAPEHEKAVCPGCKRGHLYARKL